MRLALGQCFGLADKCGRKVFACKAVDQGDQALAVLPPVFVFIRLRVVSDFSFQEALK